MKQVLFLLICTTLSVACFSQTKRVAHRSHSGSNSTFTLTGEGNFGDPGEPIIKKSLERMRLDSIAKAKEKIKNDSLKMKKPVKDSIRKPDSSNTLPSRQDAVMIMLLDLSERMYRLRFII